MAGPPLTVHCIAVSEGFTLCFQALGQPEGALHSPAAGSTSPAASSGRGRLWQCASANFPLCLCGSLSGRSFRQFSGRAFLWLAVRTELPAIFWQGVPVTRCKDGALGNSHGLLPQEGTGGDRVNQQPWAGSLHSSPAVSILAPFWFPCWGNRRG